MSTLGASLERSGLGVDPLRIASRRRTARRAARSTPAAASGGGRISDSDVTAVASQTSQQSSRRVALASIVLAAASVGEVRDPSAVASTSEPIVGDCPECVGVVNDLLNSCPPETEACVSSQDDDEYHFTAPWAYPGDRATAMRRLVAVATGAEEGRVAGESSPDSPDAGASIDVYGRDKREVAEFIVGATGAFIRGGGRDSLPPKPPIRAAPSRGGGGMGVGLVGKVFGADDAGAGSIPATAVRVAAYDEAAGYVRLVAGNDAAGTAGDTAGDTAGAGTAAVGVLFAYSLLYGNEGFYRAVVADADAVRALVSALLRRAHVDAEVGGSIPASVASRMKNGARVASAATATLAMLSQDPAVNRAVHSTDTSPSSSSSYDRNGRDGRNGRNGRNDRTDWFNSTDAAAKAMFGSKIAGRPARQSLGSAWVLVLCRVARAEKTSGEKTTSGERTKTSGEGGVEPGTSWFQSACALAALANSAAHFDGLSSAASQRLVAVFDVLHRRRRKAMAAIEPGIEPGSERRGGSVPTALTSRRTREGRPASDLAAVVTAAMASALANSARLCPELVYVALQRRDEVFVPFLEEFLETSGKNVRREGGDEESFQPSNVRVREHAFAIRRSLDSFNARVDAAMRAGRGDAPGTHWTMDEAMDVIRATCEEDRSKEDRSKEDRSMEDSGVGGFEPGTFGSSRVGRESETTRSFDAYASETFVYREEMDAHEFFRPIVDLALSGRRR